MICRNANASHHRATGAGQQHWPGEGEGDIRGEVPPPGAAPGRLQGKPIRACIACDTCALHSGQRSRVQPCSPPAVAGCSPAAASEAWTAAELRALHAAQWQAMQQA